MVLHVRSIVLFRVVLLWQAGLVGLVLRLVLVFLPFLVPLPFLILRNIPRLGNILLSFCYLLRFNS